MMRNDYRRALILLRSDAPGHSGHVRLERRTLMGSMYFLVQAPPDCEALRVALVGRGRAGYYACALGEMRRDARGQATLGYNFDPRNICGRALEQYQLIAVTCAGDADCRVLLYGNVNGHAELNWERARTALCGLYASGGAARTEAPPASGLPEAETMERAGGAQNPSEAPAPGADAQGDANGAGIPKAPGAAQSAPPQGDARAEQIGAPRAGANESAQDGEADGDAPGGAAAPDANAAPQSDAPQSTTAPQSDAPRDDAGEMPRSAAAQTDAQAVRSAISLLPIDPAPPWPEGAEDLRALFAELPPMENPPDAEFIYIAAPMPEDSGYPYCAVGARAEGGEIAAIRYALPAAWTAEPPAGLEGHRWLGDQNRGWWIADAAL